MPATRPTRSGPSRLRRDRHHHEEDRHARIPHARLHSSAPRQTREIMEVRRLSTYGDVAVFGDRGEVACIPHKGCWLEVVAAGEATHREVNQLLPGQVTRYTRSFFLGDRFELPSGTRVGLPHLAGFKLQLAASRTAPLPEEDAVVRRVTREKLDVAETVVDTAVASRR